MLAGYLRMRSCPVMRDADISGNEVFRHSAAHRDLRQAGSVGVIGDACPVALVVSRQGLGADSNRWRVTSSTTPTAKLTVALRLLPAKPPTSDTRASASPTPAARPIGPGLLSHLESVNFSIPIKCGLIWTRAPDSARPGSQPGGNFPQTGGRDSELASPSTEASQRWQNATLKAPV